MVCSILENALETNDVFVVEEIKFRLTQLFKGMSQYLLSLSLSLSEGLAVGVGFGAVGKSPLATLESARYACCHGDIGHYTVSNY